MGNRINRFRDIFQKASHMKREKVIDLKQQLIGLFDKEDVLAFFDFLLIVDRTETVPGLCKIAEPKAGESKSNYLSLLFIIDTIDDRMKDRVDSIMKGISWGEFKQYLKGIDMLIPMPHVSYETQHYLEEIEIYLSPQLRITKPYLADDLYPAIVKTLGCRGNGLIFWDEFPLNKEVINKDSIPKETDRSLIDQMIAYFKGR